MSLYFEIPWSHLRRQVLLRLRSFLAPQASSWFPMENLLFLRLYGPPIFQSGLHRLETSDGSTSSLAAAHSALKAIHARALYRIEGELGPPNTGRPVFSTIAIWSRNSLWLLEEGGFQKAQKQKISGNQFE